MELIPQSPDMSVAPTLCLNMIVKNESKVILRLLSSVESIIDCYCICDTGSTDDTKELITSFFKERNIPGKIVDEPFKNFSHNRNVALKACLGMSDFVLLLDADMIFDSRNFVKQVHLRLADHYFILQGNDSFMYQNLRIVKNDGRYSYVGVTHEYIDTPEKARSYNFSRNDCFINDVGDGGAKTDKFERDIRLFLEDIKEHPETVRSYFYLANSYADIGKYDEAIENYKKRIDLGGWREEVWYSYYRMGMCYLYQGKIENAIYQWLAAFDFYQERLENMFEIIKHYREKSRHGIAHIFYKMAKAILDKNLNRESYLFLHNDVYRFKIYNEYTIFAYYENIKNIDPEMMAVFNYGKDHDVNVLLGNLKFYKNILKTTKRVVLDNTVFQEINGEETKMTSSSSCILPKPNCPGEYIVNQRYVNYYITENGSYLNCDKYIITGNRYLELDDQLKIKKEEWISINFDGRRYIGVEDVRIFQDPYENKLVYIGTGYQKKEKLGAVMGDYDPTSNLVSRELYQTFRETACEKNWVFVDYHKKIHLVYDWCPLQIGELDGDELKVVEVKRMPNIFRRVRGSTCGFRCDAPLDPNRVFDQEKEQDRIEMEFSTQEIWFVGHIVSYESPRDYYHIISVFDADMNLLRYSAPFKFEGDNIEYCLGLVVESDRVLFSYSTWDRSSRIAICKREYIESLLTYTPERTM